MPDIANRTKIEESLSEVIAKLLARQRREFMPAIDYSPPEETDHRYGAIWLPRWRRLAEVLTIGLAIPLVDIHRIGRRGMDRLFGLGLDPDYGDALSMQWGVERAKAAADLITANTRKMFEAANAKDLPSDVTRTEILEAATELIFHRHRAENIAITETTNAHSAGEFAARNELQARGQDGAKPTLYAHWQTADDDKVCPICLPLNDKPEYLWVPKFPNGPPAHNRCRCFLDWRE